MAKTILAQLFHGEINPSEHPRPQDKHYKQAVENIGEAARSLCATLTPNQQLLYETLKDHYYIVADIEYAAIFEVGFKLGMTIAVEGLADTRLPIESVSVTVTTNGGESDDS